MAISITIYRYANIALHTFLNICYIVSIERNKRNKGIKMKVTVCIGSSCHLKGSRQIVQIFQNLIKENNLKDKVDLSGTFCMGNCQQGVNVTVDGKIFSISPEIAESFFKEKVISALKQVE